MQTNPLLPTRSPVVELPARGCQFHAGQKNEQGFLVFCGKPLKPGYSYCVEHHRKVYQRVAPMKSAHVVVEVAPEPTEVAMPEIEREAA
jgi:hypothetical protein